MIALSMAAQTWSPSNEAPGPVTMNRSLLGWANYFCLGTRRSSLALPEMHKRFDDIDIRKSPPLRGGRWWLHAISVAARGWMSRVG